MKRKISNWLHAMQQNTKIFNRRTTASFATLIKRKTIHTAKEIFSTWSKRKKYDEHYYSN